MINVGITGGETIAAGELVRLLINHPDVVVKWVSSNEDYGKLNKVHKGLVGDCDIDFTDPVMEDVDVIFACDPQGVDQSLEVRRENDKLRVINIANVKLPPGEPTIYGLCEINRKFMVHDCYSVVKMPSVYAMTVLLSLVPVAKNLLLGDRVEVELTCSQMEKDVDLPLLEAEVRTVLSALQPSFAGAIHFTIVEGESVRGVKSEVTIPCSVDVALVKEMYESYYDDHNFTFLTSQDIDSSDVVNTNKCLLNINSDGKMLRIKSVADGLLKGCAGNAVHVMNLLFGLHERVGLNLKAQVY